MTTPTRLASAFAAFAKRAPMEAAFLVFATPYALRVAYNVVTLRATDSDKLREEEMEMEEVRIRGKVFHSTVPKDKDNQVDLSLTGALPYWVPVSLLGIETLGLFFDGAKHFERKGFTPAQRARFQVFLFFGLLPLADMVLGNDWKNPSSKQLEESEKRLRWRFRGPLYLWCVISAMLNLAAFRVAFAKGNGLSARSRFHILANLALLNGAFGINISHELIHKNSVLEKFLGNMLLVFVNYVHWGAEHLDGHHETVATPADPATAKRGESIFSFLPRTVVGGFLSSCELERKRLDASGLSWYDPTHNRIFHGVAASAVWSLVLAKYAGTWKAIPAFYATALTSASLLEVVNYMEHYGLERRKVSVVGGGAGGADKYEPVDVRHSWNSPQIVSNLILFKLGRHSDHHSLGNAMRPYEMLRNFKESPMLPTGYIGMYLSLIHI